MLKQEAVSEFKQTYQEEQVTPEEDKKLRMFAKLLVDKLFEDIHSGKVGNNG